MKWTQHLLHALFPLCPQEATALAADGIDEGEMQVAGMLSLAIPANPGPAAVVSQGEDEPSTVVPAVGGDVLYVSGKAPSPLPAPLPAVTMTHTDTQACAQTHTDLLTCLESPRHMLQHC